MAWSFLSSGRHKAEGILARPVSWVFSFAPGPSAGRREAEAEQSHPSGAFLSFFLSHFNSAGLRTETQMSQDFMIWKRTEITAVKPGWDVFEMVGSPVR